MRRRKQHKNTHHVCEEDGHDYQPQSGYSICKYCDKIINVTNLNLHVVNANELEGKVQYLIN